MVKSITILPKEYIAFTGEKTLTNLKLIFTKE
jgi:hypothetical protein